MNRTFPFRNWLENLIILLIPIPLSLCLAELLIATIGTTSLGELNSALFDLYESLGLYDASFFPWSWVTIFMMLYALPYVLLVWLTRLILLWRNGSLQDAPFTALNSLLWLAILVIPAPTTLWILRALWTVNALPQFGRYAETLGARIVSGACAWLLFACPYTLISLSIHFLICKTRKEAR